MKIIDKYLLMAACSVSGIAACIFLYQLGPESVPFIVSIIGFFAACLATIQECSK